MKLSFDYLQEVCSYILLSHDVVVEYFLPPSLSDFYPCMISRLFFSKKENGHSQTLRILKKEKNREITSGDQFLKCEFKNSTTVYSKKSNQVDQNMFKVVGNDNEFKTTKIYLCM